MIFKDKNRIITWLDSYDIENYTLIPDSHYGFVVNVEGNVDLSNQNLSQI